MEIILRNAKENPTFLSLGENELHIWEWSCPEKWQIGEGMKQLIPEEREKAERFLHPKVREQFVVARAGLRKLLAAYLQIPPLEVPIEYGFNGKPELAQAFGAWQFNLSHSEGQVALGIIKQRRIGIDLEKIREIKNIPSLVKRFFCPAEIALFDGLSEKEQNQQFLEVWTCKEALLKGIGRGIHGLESSELIFGKDDTIRVHRLNDPQNRDYPWQIRKYMREPCWLLAVAWEDSHEAVIGR